VPFCQFSQHGNMHQMVRSALARAIWALVAIQCLLAPASADTGNKVTLGSQFTPAIEHQELIEQFITCFSAGTDLKSGGQVVLNKNTAWCDEAGEKDPHYSALKDSSLVDWISPDPCGGKGLDHRRLDSNLIKEIIGKNDSAAKNEDTAKGDAPARIKASGIRIIGAAFCSGEVDLDDIDVPYSVVLDYGLFKFGIRAQNLKTDENFSIDNSVVFENFVLTGAKIGRNLYATDAFIRYLTLQVASQVGGSLYLSGSLIANSINVLNTTIKGDLHARGTATPDFVISSNSQISGQLDISQSEARCSFRLQPFAVGDFVAQTTGFGQVSLDNDVDWQRAKSSHRIKKFLDSPAIQPIDAEYAKCRDSGYWKYMFLVSGMKAKSFCLSDFQGDFPHDLPGLAPGPQSASPE
jgi:hypothetical protein